MSRILKITFIAKFPSFVNSSEGILIAFPSCRVPAAKLKFSHFSRFDYRGFYSRENSLVESIITIQLRTFARPEISQ